MKFLQSSEGRKQKRNMDLDAEESSSWLEKDSNQTFIPKNGHPRCTKCQVICSAVSLIISTVLIILILAFSRYVQRKEDQQLAYSSGSYMSPPGNVICVPCERNIQTFPDMFSVNSTKLFLCCKNNEALIPLIKLLEGQLKTNTASLARNTSVQKDAYALQKENRNIQITVRGSHLAGTSNSPLNFTVLEEGLYSVYFHLTLRVPETSKNFTQMSLTVTLEHTVNDTGDIILSKKLALQIPLPSGGYENIVLLENIHLARGTYRIQLSDATSVYNFYGCNSLTIHQI